MSSPNTKSSAIVHANNWFQIQHDELEWSSGYQSDYYYMVKPHFAVIVPRVAEKLILVEQYRHPVQQTLLEFPKGSSNQDESLSQCARRELEEETGFYANTLTKLGFLYLAPGIITQGYNVYYASDCVSGNQRLDAGEADLKVYEYSPEAIQQMIENGQIQDSETIAAFFLYQRKINHP